MTEEPSRSDKETNIVEVLVGDPLTPVTRKERVYLLAVSLISIAIVKTGLVPSKIATLGIELNQPDKRALLGLLAIVTAYFLVAFLVYAASDYVTRREVLALIKRRIKEPWVGGQQIRSVQEEQRESEQEVGTVQEGQTGPKTPEETKRQETSEPDVRAPRYVSRAYKRVAREPKPVPEWAGPLQSVFEILDRTFIFIARQLDRIANLAIPILQRGIIPFARQMNRTMEFFVYAFDPLTSAAVRLDLSTLRELTRDEELYQLGASRSSRIVAAFRIVFEFVLPILVGIYAIYTLLTGSSNPPGI